MIDTIQLIVSDIDGTLSDAKGQIPARNMQALQECQKRGIRIALCSGRQAADMAYISKQLQMENIALLSLNGTYCLEKSGAAPFWEAKMNTASARDCVRIFESLDVAFNCFSGNVLINNRIPAYEKDPAFWTEERKSRRKLITHLYGQNYIDEYLQKGIQKFSFVELHDKSKLQAVRSAFQNVPDIELTSSWSCNFEIMPKGAHKGLGLQKLCEHWEISPSDCLAFGDNDNDLPLFKAAGLSVCMSNASAKAKATADFQTLSNEDAGLGVFLEKYILNKSVKIP